MSTDQAAPRYVLSADGMTLTGFSVGAGDGVINVVLRGSRPGLAVGGSLERETAVRLALTILDVAGETRDIAELREKIRRQAAVIREQQLVLERKNRELDALHYVWCDGGCPRGVHRWSDALITRDLVEAAERNTARLRRWYGIVEWRMRLPGADAWQRKRRERAASKTDLAGLPSDHDLCATRRLPPAPPRAGSLVRAGTGPVSGVRSGPGEACRRPADRRRPQDRTDRLAAGSPLGETFRDRGVRPPRCGSAGERQRLRRLVPVSPPR